jgi:hypothetical protein
MYFRDRREKFLPGRFSFNQLKRRVPLNDDTLLSLFHLIYKPLQAP